MLRSAPVSLHDRVDTSEESLPQVGRLVSGWELLDRRRRAGLSIEDMSTLTNIPAAKIEAIENGSAFTIADNARLKEVLLAWRQTFHMDVGGSQTHPRGPRKPRRGLGSYEADERRAG